MWSHGMCGHVNQMFSICGCSVSTSFRITMSCLAGGGEGGSVILMTLSRHHY